MSASARPALGAALLVVEYLAISFLFDARELVPRSLKALGDIAPLPLIVVHCSISRSPSELPNAAIGRRPMCSLMPTGLPALSSMKLISGRRNRMGCPSRISNRVLIDEPTTCSGGTP